MKKKARFVANEDLIGIRLDKCIGALDRGITRMAAQRLLASGKITVNRKSAKTII